MFRAESALAPTSPDAVHNTSDCAVHPTPLPPITAASLPHRFIISPLPLPLSTLTPLESALPQNQISHSANPIESTPFLHIAPFRTNSAPVTPAFTTLTKHTPRDPFRMNTSAKHQVAPHRAHLATNSPKISYVKMNTTRSGHSTHTSAQNSQPCADTPVPQLTLVARAARLAALWYTFTSRTQHTQLHDFSLWQTRKGRAVTSRQTEGLGQQDQGRVVGDRRHHFSGPAQDRSRATETTGNGAALRRLGRGHHQRNSCFRARKARSQRALRCFATQADRKSTRLNSSHEWISY